MTRVFEQNIPVLFESRTESSEESLGPLLFDDRLSPGGKVHHPRPPTPIMTSNDKKFVIFVLIVGVAALVVMIGFIGQGNIRVVPIFFQEQVKQTVAFQEVDGKVKLVGISGIGEDNNPTLIMRISFAYVLTVINQGETQHRLYIDGFDVQTDLLFPGEQDTITIYPKEEGEYNYYDKRQQLVLLGKLKAVEVVPSDSFEGIMRDLI